MGNYKVWTAVLSALVVAAGSGVIARRVVHTAHHQEVKAYIIPMVDAAPAGPVSDVVPPISPLLAKADVAHGEQIFKQCAVCHTTKKGEPHKIGPNLWGVIGAAMAHCADYAYSDAFTKQKCVWDYEKLNLYLQKPRKLVPGTKMSFAGLPKEQDRADIIAYLRTLSDNPLPLPAP